MTRPSKKMAEREIANRLLSTIDHLDAEIDAKGEKPDIILKVPSRTIGLELTTYQSGKTVRIGGKKNLTERQVEAAWECFERASRPFRNKNADLKNISITFWFKNILPPKEEWEAHPAVPGWSICSMRVCRAPAISVGREGTWSG
jgi:hypothetical protein